MNTATSAASEAGVTNPFGKGFCFQSSPSHLKRFIMFDSSGGHGRVFVHPALAQELFGPSQRREGQDESEGKQPGASNTSPSDESAMKIIAYRKVVASAFSSLQMLRNSRRINLESMEQKVPIAGMCNNSVATDEPRVSGAMDVAAPHVRAVNVPTNGHMASETLARQMEPKFFATLASVKRSRFSETLGSTEFSPFSGSDNVDVKQEADSASTEGWENPDDLDALLSSDEDEDDDVRSTGHSPGESSEKGENCNEEEDDGGEAEVQQQKTNKRTRMDREGTVTSFREEVKMTGAIQGNASIHGQGTGQGNACLHVQDAGQGNADLHVQDAYQECRRQKIKKTMKVLRKMIPGGAFLDPAVVLDETIQYLKSLSNQVNQIESARLPPAQL